MDENSYTDDDSVSHKRKFSPDDDSLLIDLVRQNPPLYRMSNRSYKDLVVKNNIWKEIAMIMKKDEKTCQARWKNIRDYYQKKKKIAVKGLRKGPTRNRKIASFVSKHPHLAFLENTSFALRKSIGDTAESSQGCNNGTQQNAESVSSELYYDVKTESKDITHVEDTGYSHDAMDSDSGSDADSQEVHQDYSLDAATKSSTTSNTPKYMKLSMSSDKSELIEELKTCQMEIRLLKDLLRPQPDKPKESATSIFFRSIASTVEQFIPVLQVQAKARIMSLIAELEIENLNQANSGK